MQKIWWWQSEMVLDGGKFGYAFWNDDVFNPDITEPTLKPIASNESNSSEKPAQTNIIKPTENQRH